MPQRVIRSLARSTIGAVLAASLLCAFILGAAAVPASAQTPTPTPAPQQAMHQQMHPLPPELQFLRTMTPTQRFDSFIGAQMTWRNPQGQEVVLNVIPGKIDSIGANAVTITPNGATQSRTFNVTQNTYIVSRPRQGTLSAFSPGDRVIVTAVGNSSNAAAIVEHGRGMGMMP